MPKPFDEAIKLKGICRFCKVGTTVTDDRKFNCERVNLGTFTDFCTKVDYLDCPFNADRMSAYRRGMERKPEPVKKVVAPPLDRASGKPEYSAAYIDELKALVFKDAGEFKREALKRLNMQPSQVDHVTKDYNLTKPEPRQRAWLDCIQHYEKWLKEKR